jgi:hypothetical protein
VALTSPRSLSRYACIPVTSPSRAPVSPSVFASTCSPSSASCWRNCGLSTCSAISIDVQNWANRSASSFGTDSVYRGSYGVSFRHSDGLVETTGCTIGGGPPGIRLGSLSAAPAMPVAAIVTATVIVIATAMPFRQVFRMSGALRSRVRVPSMGP